MYRPIDFFQKTNLSRQPVVVPTILGQGEPHDIIVNSQYAAEEDMALVLLLKTGQESSNHSLDHDNLSKA